MVRTDGRGTWGRRGARWTARAVGLLWLAVLLPARTGRADDATRPPDKQVDKVDVAVKKEPKVKPDDPKAAERVQTRTASLSGVELDWHTRFVADPTGSLSTTAQSTLDFARDKTYTRAQAVHDLEAGGTLTKPLVRSLDVGRHELLKHLYHRAMVVANERRAAQGLSPVSKMQAVNAGGTGDYTRDQDITVFLDDPEREKAFFDAVEWVAREELKLQTDVKATGGIDFPQLEVTLFNGSNDLPDARFATDVEEFAVKYRRAIENQAADKEAYKGGGADIEVKGRRKPGSMLVQQLTWTEAGPRYVAETPQNFREAASIFSGTAPERWQRFELAAHVFSDFVQGRQHSEGPGHALTKGPLKYAGRAVEHLCTLYGMKPWKDLAPDDRVALLRRVWPHLDPKTGMGARVLAQISGALDVATYVKKEKELPGGLDAAAAAKADQVMLGFLRNATGLTVGKMAQDMLHPPAFDTKAMRAVFGARWDEMTPAQRFKAAAERDATFRAATSRAAMENLLVTVSLLRNMDFQDGLPAKDRPGEHLLARVLRDAEPHTRAVLTLASDYAEAWARKQQSADPQVRAECDRQLDAVRKKLVAHCPAVGGEMPSLALLRKATKDGPRAVLAAETAPGRRWLSPEAVEVKNAFLDHLKRAFPSHGEQWREFTSTVKEIGMKGYLGRRLVEETFQWDTIADALTLVEMYQGGAGADAYGEFLAVNLVSRIHWSVGPLVQAFKVYDQDPRQAAAKFKELGKSLVFSTLSRVVPWAASAKIAFDVARGTVVVTVGWAVGKANTALVDAVYTGEAGRTDDAAAGKAWGRIRDAGVSVLPATVVRRVTDEKTGAVRIDVDRDALYLEAFRRWTGADGDDVPRSSPPRPEAARLTSAHDAFVRVLRKEAEQHGSTWVPDPDHPFVPLRLGEREVEEAIAAFEPLLRERAQTEVDAVLSELAVREYRSYLDAEGTDVIREGLVRRYASDLLGGVIEHWHVRLTSEVLAARDIERTAVFSDWRAMAGRLHERYVPSAQRVEPLEVRLQGGRWRVVRREDGSTELHGKDAKEGEPPAATLRVQAKASGVPVLDGTAYDGREPVQVRASLEGTGETGDDEKDVKLEISTQRLRKLRKVGDPDDDGPVQAGDVAEDRIVVRALAAGGAGPELARTELVVHVLIPEQDETSVPVWERVEVRRDGTPYERYRFVRAFDGMPDDWVSDGGLVYHGAYERLYEDGTPSEVRRYRFGVLDGKTEVFDTKGRLVHEVPYVRGRWHGDDVRYDPDSQGRLVYKYVDNRPVEQLATGTKGQRLVRITYVWEPEPSGAWIVASGEAEAWWSAGGPRWRGRYAGARPDLNSQGGSDGEEIRAKDGPWEWWFADGQLAHHITFARGVREGSYEGWRGAVDRWGRPSVGSEDRPAEADVRDVGAYAADRRSGTWQHFDGLQRPLGSTEYEADEGVRGEKITWHKTGKKASQGRWTKAGDEGVCLTWHENGELASSTTYVNGERTGPYVRRGEGGALEEEGTYREGKREGRCKTYDAAGHVSTDGMYEADERDGPWRAYEDGRPTESGTYKQGKRHGLWTFWDRKGKAFEERYRDGELLPKK